MHSISTRINSVFFYGISGIAVLAIFNILTTIFLYKEPKNVLFQITQPFTMYKNPYTKIQHSSSYFNLYADFTECVNWNTNNIFVWISAEYETGNKLSQKTQVTIYDKIITRSSGKYIVELNDQIFEYPLVDVYGSMK